MWHKQQEGDEACTSLKQDFKEQLSTPAVIVKYQVIEPELLHKKKQKVYSTQRTMPSVYFRRCVQKYAKFIPTQVYQPYKQEIDKIDSKKLHWFIISILGFSIHTFACHLKWYQLTHHSNRVFLSIAGLLLFPQMYWSNKQQKLNDKFYIRNKQLVSKLFTELQLEKSHVDKIVG